MITMRELLSERSRIVDDEIMPHLSGEDKFKLRIILCDLSLPEIYLMKMFIRGEIKEREFKKYETLGVKIVIGMLNM